MQNIKNIPMIMMMMMMVPMMMGATMMSYSVVVNPSYCPKGEYEATNGH
jgi:hypothetical protein